ncbi:DUF2911 domain-containing protein [uncultured Algibacter sp.]|uniref:DUF2911 domain-containing protein n=1 Tax=uncultured Algibacter sp. TaxID=298659 RepID=UPI00260834F2|nr:DUF2911 domain-containing protein [uncultured Algibacter sp.]
MKKTTLLSTIAFAFILLLTTNVSAQKFADVDKSPLDASFYKNDRKSPAIIKVVYSRPYLKGRDLSKLAPNGKVWRTGANEAADITFYNNMKIGEDTIEAGTYSLFTIPGEKEWTIILNSDINVWGAYSYNESKDVVRVKVPVSTGSTSIENFSIAFEKTESGANMHLAWGTMRLAVPFTN